MALDQTCPDCGAKLPTHAPDPICLVCLLGDKEGDKVRYFGDYELLREIGRGGMGIVYRARQRTLKRIVAIKTMRADGPLGNPEQARRFQTEAEAAAGLDHPNIVPVYEVGTHDGFPYLSMKLIEGVSLADWRKQRPELGAPHHAIASLMAKIAQAIHHAHQRGVLHRDLKPENILLDNANEPHVTDFGLAKLVGADALLTHSGALLGTPAYMAPEQARSSRNATTASDIYSLGAVLYYLLTGIPPFQGTSISDVLQQVKNDEPKHPHLVSPGGDLDLATICLKCLRKEPSGRYASAAGLAEDLERFLRGEPIQARPVSPPERLWLWCQRNPTISLLVFGLFFAILAGAISSELLRQRAERARRDVERNRDDLRLNLYAADIKLAEQAISESNLRQARELLLRQIPLNGAPDLRGLDWHLLDVRAKGEAVTIFTNLPAGAQALRFSPDDRWLIAGDSKGHLWRWDWRNSSDLEVLTQLPENVLAIDFSPSGKELVVACHHANQATGSIEVLGWPDCTRLASLPSAATRVVFAPDGRTVIATTGEGTHVRGERALEVWNWIQGKRTARFPDLGNRLALAPSGIRLIVGSHAPTNLASQQTSSWTWMEFPSLRLLTTVPAEATTSGFSFAPDGSVVLATANFGRVQAWDTETGEYTVTELPGAGFLPSIAPVPRSHWLGVTAGGDHRLHILEWARHPLRLTWQYALKSDRDNLHALAAASDGHTLATTSADRTVQLWDLRRSVSSFAHTFTNAASYRTAAQTVLFSPDSHHLAVRHADGAIRLYDASTAEMAATLALHDELLGFTPDSRRLVTLAATNKICFWSWRDHQLAASAVLETAPEPLRVYELSPNARWLAAGGLEDGIWLWDTHTGARTRNLAVYKGRTSAIHFSPDSQWLVAGGADGRMCRWDIATGRLAWQKQISSRLLWCVRFSPDGRIIATCGRDRTLSLWQAEDGALIRRITGERAGIGWLSWAPDQQRIVTSGHQFMRFWHLPTGRELMRIASPAAYIQAIVSPDGKTLAALEDSTVRVWHVDPSESGLNPGQITR